MDNTKGDLDEFNFLQIRLRPKPVFRRPPSPPSRQQCENLQLSDPTQQREKIIHSSQSQVGDNQGTSLWDLSDKHPGSLLTCLR